MLVDVLLVSFQTDFLGENLKKYISLFVAESLFCICGTFVWSMDKQVSP